MTRSTILILGLSVFVGVGIGCLVTSGSSEQAAALEQPGLTVSPSEGRPAEPSDAGGGDPVRTQQTATRVALPAGRRRGLPLLRASIDGGSPGYFILDSGASGHVIARSVAREQGWQPTGETLHVSPAGSRTAPVHERRELVIGPLRLEAPSFVEADLAALSAALGERLRGILGIQVLEQGAFEIDLDASTVHWYPSDVNVTAEVDWIPMELRDGSPIVGARVGDRAVRLLIDTGSNAEWTLYEQVLDELGLAEVAVADVEARDVSSAMSVRSIRIPSVAVAGVMDRGVTALVHTPSATSSRDGLHGSIGSGFLRGRRVFLDVPRRRFALTGRHSLGPRRR